jgi:hypothetical protein
MTQNQMKNFKSILKSPFGLQGARTSFLILLLEAFIKSRSVNLSKLFTFIPVQVKASSTYKRL